MSSSVQSNIHFLIFAEIILPKLTFRTILQKQILIWT